MQVHVVGDLDQAMSATTPKLVIVAPSQVIERTLPEVLRRWEGRLYVATSMPTYIEITNPDADKRQALSWLCRLFGVLEEQTVAVGDGRNDIPMIEWAGRGYAIEGAQPEVVAAAGGRIVGRPGSGGIAHLVEELLG